MKKQEFPKWTPPVSTESQQGPKMEGDPSVKVPESIVRTVLKKILELRAGTQSDQDAVNELIDAVLNPVFIGTIENGKYSWIYGLKLKSIPVPILDKNNEPITNKDGEKRIVFLLNKDNTVPQAVRSVIEEVFVKDEGTGKISYRLQK